jgi:lipopolysaccharide export LptBFGC system permease protein LptF
MVPILHRYIFWETFKIFALATVALSVILSLGMILRPVQEIGVGPQQVMYLIGFMLPITLTFVLPIAALFAASLSYGRFTADNELDACRASGIGMYSLVYPGLALAILVAIANLFLSFYITPTFVQRAEKSLKADAQKILFRNIQQKGFYKAPDSSWQIYADLADPKNEILSGVVITEVKHSKIERIVTCDDAYVHINTSSRFNEVQITAKNTSLVDMTGNKTSYAESPNLSIVREFPPLLGDDIKFKKIDEIKQIRADFMNFNPIAKEAYVIYAQYAAELLTKDILQQMTGKQDKYYRLLSGQKLLRFNADKCTSKGEQKILLEGNVNLEEYIDSSARLPDRISDSSQASIQINIENGKPALTMVLFNAHWHTKSGSSGIADRLTFQNISLPANITKIINDTSAGSMLDIIDPVKIRQNLGGEPGSQLKDLLAKLNSRIRTVEASIKAETQSRLAFGIGCVPLVLIGIGLGILKKGGHLLSAFGVSSIPAAILIVCIMSGKNMTENLAAKSNMGMLLIWAGPLVLMLLAGVIYRVLLKH